MNFFTRLSNGWSIAQQSFQVLRANKQLILFPILSGIALLLVSASFVAAMLGASQWDVDLVFDKSQLTIYGSLFIFYVFNYFVIVFFNTALIHCTRLYFRGEEVSLGEGLRFASGRIASIFTWAVVAATVGTILRYISENAGSLGRLITGLIGLAWNIASFFVVPVLAYENLGPIDALRRSGQIMREKWGESLGATFSFGIIQFLVIVLVIIPLIYVSALVHPFLAIGVGVVSVTLVVAVMSAVQTIFQSAVYHQATGTGEPVFGDELINGLFEPRR